MIMISHVLEVLKTTWHMQKIRIVMYTHDPMYLKYLNNMLHMKNTDNYVLTHMNIVTP